MPDRFSRTSGAASAPELLAGRQSRQRRMGPVHFPQPVGILLDIDLGGRDRAVPQHLLQIEDVYSLAGQLRGEGVAQPVRVEIHPAPFFQPSDDHAETTVGKGHAVLRQPESAPGFLVLFQTVVLEVVGHGDPAGVAEVAGALAGLAPDDRPVAPEVDIAQPHRKQLSPAHPAVQEKGQHGQVAGSAVGFEVFGPGKFLEDPVKLLLLHALDDCARFIAAGKAHAPVEGALGDMALPFEPGEEDLDRAAVGGNRDRGEALFRGRDGQSPAEGQGRPEVGGKFAGFSGSDEAGVGAQALGVTGMLAPPPPELENLFPVVVDGPRGEAVGAAVVEPLPHQLAEGALFFGG
ncbi:MAG TPA: hypothetical protein VH186_25350 [Chloroflexia bacterium]|nr:hypothetical protein [Chloroflexia bacterium]